MDIRRIIHHRVELVRLDEIPLFFLAQENQAQTLLALFNFSGVELSEQDGKPKLTFKIGLLRDEFSAIAIIQLVIEERRILLDIEGTTEDSNKVMDKLKSHLQLLVNKSDANFLKPVLIAEESEIIAKMNFSADKLLSPALLGLVEASNSSMSYEGVATAKARLEKVTFVVQYHTNDTSLDEHRITLNRKELTFAPRPGELLSEQIYHSRAPVSTLKHKKMLEVLEVSINQG